MYDLLYNEDYHQFDYILSHYPDAINSLRNTHGGSLLMQAAEYGNDGIFRFLSEISQDLSITDENDNNILHIIMRFNRSSEMLKCLDEDQLDDHVLNQQDSYYGETPLHVAAGENRQKSIDWLVSQGADIYIRNFNGGLPGESRRSKRKTQRLLRDHRR